MSLQTPESDVITDDLILAAVYRAERHRGYRELPIGKSKNILRSQGARRRGATSKPGCQSWRELASLRQAAGTASRCGRSLRRVASA
jgi:hypothetical protein